MKFNITLDGSYELNFFTKEKKIGPNIVMNPSLGFSEEHQVTPAPVIKGLRGL